MIKRIRNWTDKSFENRQHFIALCIIVCQIIWFIPFSIFEIIKFGLFGTMPRYFIFIVLSLTLLSIWIGFKIGMKFLYGKEK